MKHCNSKPSNMRRRSAKPVTLTQAQLQRLQDQAAIVIERCGVPGDVAEEGAKRIMRCLKMIAKTRSLKEQS